MLWAVSHTSKNTEIVDFYVRFDVCKWRESKNKGKDDLQLIISLLQKVVYQKWYTLLDIFRPFSLLSSAHFINYLSNLALVARICEGILSNKHTLLTKTF